MSIKQKEHLIKLAEANRLSGRYIEIARRMGLSNKGKKHTEEQKRKISMSLLGHRPWNKGMVHPIESKTKMSKAGMGNKKALGKHWKLTEETKNKMRAYRGVGRHNWKGGIKPINWRIRSTSKYLEWRLNIFKRDDFTCKKCFEKGGELDAHHKKPFSKLLQEAKNYIPLLDLYDAAMLYTPLWELSNGVTLCKKCHKEAKT